MRSRTARSPSRLLVLLFIFAIVAEQIPLLHSHAAGGLYNHECPFAGLATGPGGAVLHGLASALQPPPASDIAPVGDTPALVSLLPSTLRSRAPPRAC